MQSRPTSPQPVPYAQQMASVPDDPVFASLALGEAVNLSRSDLIGLLLRRHGATLANEPLPETGVKNVERGDTALHVACRLGRVDAVRTLLRAGVAVHSKNAKGKLALELAKESSAEQQIEQAFVAELLQNVCAGQVTRIERLLSGGIDASKTDGSPDEATLLHWAASFGQGREVVALLISGGANPNAKNKAGATPAHEASANGAVETLEALRDFGADFSIKDSKGKTPQELARTAEVAAFFSALGQQHKQMQAPVPVTLLGGSAAPVTPSMPRKSASAVALEDESSLAAPALSLKQKLPLAKVSEAANESATATSSSPEKNLRRKAEEQDALIDSLRSTIDALLREHGVQDYVARLQDHVGALTRQLAATAEQRDKLQNLYVANDRELERLARELALSRSMSPVPAPKRISSPQPQAASAVSNLKNGNHNGQQQMSSTNLELLNEIDELRAKCGELSEDLDRERKEAYAAARLHLTYEADLRAEIKALQEQMLTEVGNAAMVRDGNGSNGGGGGLLSSLIPW